KLEQGVAHKLSPVSINDNIASNLTVAADCEAEYAEVLALEEALAEAQAAYDECMGDTPSPVPDPEEATRRLAGMSSILER
ncbi:MAG: hypothetical protein KDB03_09415, partial [Planctomycetales bacterium]|nr:hypothetical protein [Planctomycetales bacterium]